LGPRVFRTLTLFVALGLASCSSSKPEGNAALVGMPVLPASEIPTDPDGLLYPDEVDGVGWGAEYQKEPMRVLQVVPTTLSGISITAVTFDSRTLRLAIADQDGEPGSRWADAEAAAKELGGIAAVNGGFFTPEGKPLGLVVSGGKKAGSLNRASSLGAGLFVGGSSPALLRREHSTNASEVLQSGPFLVENGRAISGLSQDGSTARTVIGWDGGHGWFIARTGACSLAKLGQALAGARIGGVKVRTVLNLDGGRSSDLWVSSSVPGGPVSQRPFWNKPVRNFLVLVPRR
jgi:uncharacterized protein YigE (DUF2233 family)